MRMSLLLYADAPKEKLNAEMDLVERRLQQQYWINGAAPMEFLRHTGLHYVHFSLMGWLHLAEMMDKSGKFTRSLFDTTHARCGSAQATYVELGQPFNMSKCDANPDMPVEKCLSKYLYELC